MTCQQTTRSSLIPKKRSTSQSETHLSKKNIKHGDVRGCEACRLLRAPGNADASFVYQVIPAHVTSKRGTPWSVQFSVLVGAKHLLSIIHFAYVEEAERGQCMRARYDAALEANT